MKLVRFDNWATGIVVQRDSQEQILDIGASLPALNRAEPTAAAQLQGFFGPTAGSDWAPLISAWHSVRNLLKELADRASRERGPELFVRRFDSVRLLPPLASRRCSIFAVGGNFTAHLVRVAKAIRGQELSPDHFLAERDKGLTPQGFFVMPSTVVASGDPITPPPGVAKLDYEAEIAVILSSNGRNLPSEEVRIWGVAPWHDVSIRDPHLKVGLPIDRGALPWGLQKNWFSGNICGPYVAVDEIKDTSAIEFQCRVNGEVRQSATTKDMVWTFQQAVSHMSKYVPIEVGDLFTSGSPMGTAIESGINGPFLNHGDLVEIEVKGIGTLSNRVVIGAN